MSAERDETRIVRSWLEDGVTVLPDRVLDAVLDQLPATHQRRAWWPARRFHNMNYPVRIALVAAAVLVVAFLGIRFLLPGQNVGVPGTTPIPTATPLAPHEGALAAGTYIAHPFADASGGYAACPQAEPPDCDPTLAADITSHSPSRTAGSSLRVARMSFGRRTSKPYRLTEQASSSCGAAGSPAIRAPRRPRISPVGPTVDDFANALADHPLLDITAPVDVTLDGYSGKYVELQTPADLTECPLLPAMGSRHLRSGTGPAMAHLDPRCRWHPRGDPHR